MRTLTIGSVTLELNSFNKIRDKIIGVYADIKIPTSAISYADLKALFTDNTEDLIVTDDEGGTTTYSGYEKLDELKEKDGVYTVIQVCTSEAIHLLNEARKQIADQQKIIDTQGAKIEEQEELITLQAEEIILLNDTLLEMLIG